MGVPTLTGANSFTGLNQFNGGWETNAGITAAAWGQNGVNINVTAQTYTDNSSAAGTVTNNYVNSFGTPTLATTTNTVTYTNACTVCILNAPSNGSHVTVTNAYALDVVAGTTYLGGAVTLNGVATFNNNIATTTNGSASNFFTNGAGAQTNINTAGIQFGGSSNVSVRTIFNGTTSTSITAGNSYGGIIVGSMPITTASGTSSWLANAVIKGLGTVTPGSATITNTASLYVDAASAAGTNNYSAYINGPLSVQGSLYFNPTFVSATGTYNMTATDAFVIFTGSTATVVYPTAFNGRAFYLVNQASGTVTIPTTTSANGTTVTTLTAGNKDFMMYDGTNSVWRIIGN